MPSGIDETSELSVPAHHQSAAAATRNMRKPSNKLPRPRFSCAAAKAHQRENNNNKNTPPRKQGWPTTLLLLDSPAEPEVLFELYIYSQSCIKA
jgi:hypothetical protein